MRRVMITLLAVSLVALAAWDAPSASAQTALCDPSQFHTLTNMWKIGPEQNTGEIPAVELAAERKIMQRVAEMFRSAFVPNGAAGYTSVNYDILPHAATNTTRYGNTYEYVLSNHLIECRNNKPAVLDVSLGNVSVQVNMQFVGEVENGDASVGFSFLPRGYYQLKDGIALPKANAEGIHEFNFGDGSTVWWLTRANALPFRFVTKREFLTTQIAILKSRSTPDTARLAYYQRLLSTATDDVAFVKQAEVPGITGSAYVFTTLDDRANRIYVTGNPDYYDRGLPKSTPQKILIRVKRSDMTLLNNTGNAARHLESIQKLGTIVRANLAELRSMVK